MLTSEQERVLNGLREDTPLEVRSAHGSILDDLVISGYVERREREHYRRTSLGTVALTRHRLGQKLGSNSEPEHLLRVILVFLDLDPQDASWRDCRRLLRYDIQDFLARR
jgi:hypothetical protein